MLPYKLTFAGILALGMVSCNSNKQPHASEPGDITQERAWKKKNW